MQCKNVIYKFIVFPEVTNKRFKKNPLDFAHYNVRFLFFRVFGYIQDDCAPKQQITREKRIQ